MTVMAIKVQLSDGAKVSVWVHGWKDTSKPLLIALHGAPGISSHLDPEAAYSPFRDRFRVLVPDLRGGGASDIQGPFTDERWIADVDELRAWAGAETFVLAGGSYGGFLALGYALAFPDRLSGLILRSTWACGFRGALRVIGSIFKSHRIRPDPAKQIRLWSGNTLDEQDCQTSIAQILPIYTPETEEDAQELAAFEGTDDQLVLQWRTHNAAWSYSVPRFDVRARLSEIAAPTLVLVGRHDVICPVEDSVEINQGISGSKLVIFENSGHNPASDEPVAFEKAVSEFFETLKV